MLVTGAGGYDDNGKSADEADIVKRFQKTGGILVSTDVLSAGQNLQNAQYVVNYDFPWNPVVIIQRVGRVDRIGSPYDQVYLINVLPESSSPEDPESLEFFLGLMERLYKRLEAIRSTIG
jgi:superfamily II DNA/RNA helicase